MWTALATASVITIKGATTVALFMFVPDQPKAPTDEPAHNIIIIKKSVITIHYDRYKHV